MQKFYDMTSDLPCRYGSAAIRACQTFAGGLTNTKANEKTKNLSQKSEGKEKNKRHMKKGIGYLRDLLGFLKSGHRP